MIDSTSELIKIGVNLNLSNYNFWMVISSGCLNAQSSQPKLNPIMLMKQLIGTWHINVSKDTVEGWEFKPIGKSMTMTYFK